MKIVLDDGAFKPYKAHPEDAGFDLMARERQNMSKPIAYKKK